MIGTLNGTEEFGVLPYEPSTVAPDKPRELERFFETMDQVAQEGKRPDLLLYDKSTFGCVSKEIVKRIGGLEKLPTTPSDVFGDVIAKARAAIEVENSLWVTEQMPGFRKKFSRFSQGKRTGRLKAAGIVPTIIVKNEDVPGLKHWEATFGIPIYIVHIFYDRGYFIRFREVLDAVRRGDIGPEEQKYTNPDGTASSPKQIVKVPYVLCKEFGKVCEPQRAFRQQRAEQLTLCERKATYRRASSC